MKKHLMIVPLLAIVCLMIQSESKATAQEGVRVYAHSGGFGSFSDHRRANLYSSGIIPTPPYFAIHPPVYYSMPVPRAYGYSPYAYPNYVRTPEPKVTKPVMHRNPFVENVAPENAKATDRTAIAPRTTINPFVIDQPTNVAATR